MLKTPVIVGLKFDGQDLQRNLALQHLLTDHVRHVTISPFLVVSPPPLIVATTASQANSWRQLLTTSVTNHLMRERYLPAELWPGILSRLPVKSLLRFRCVSKSWLSLIDDRDFARSHLKSFKNNIDETHLFVVQGLDQHCILRCSDTWETDEAPLDNTLGRNLCEGSWQVVCSIDGLVLLKDCETIIMKNRNLKLWNPSIRKSHDFPLYLPEIVTSLEGFSLEIEIGLGYDPLLEDYKHVRLLLKEYPIEPCFAIYTLGVDSWKIIEFQGKGCSWHWLPSSLDMKVYLQGSLYFIARDLTDLLTTVWELVSIDLRSEVFSSTSLPDFPNFESRRFEGDLTLVDGGCSLAAFGSESSDSSSLWVLESESMSWSRRYLLSLRVPEFLYLKKNGDILIWQCSEDEETPSRVSPDKELEQRWISYNPETAKEKILLQKKCCVVNTSGVFGYVESLILLK